MKELMGGTFCQKCTGTKRGKGAPAELLPINRTSICLFILNNYLFVAVIKKLVKFTCIANAL
jgi:hypothetical protein